MSELRKEYPPIEPYFTSFLQVSDLHRLYYEQSGNPQGKPAVVLHGGPGGGSSPFYRQFFNPEKYRIIMFDQRGAGSSQPSASLEQNTTWDLVDDIEKIRKELNIEKWIVFGGSWGSTLALAYAETYPEQVAALVLRGIFTLRREELIWFYQQGASFCFPDAWDGYLEPIPPAERFELLSSYHRRLVGDNEEEKLKCAKAWSKWELSTSRLYVDPAYYAKAEEDKFALAFARIESHYFVNAGFFKEDGQLINNAHILKNIPGVIVQGRYDMVCPMKTAWDLKKAAPHFEFHVIKDAGHSCVEPGIVDQLVRACDKYADLEF